MDRTRSMHGWENNSHVRGRVSKYIRNGSKTAVMDVRVFLCVLLSCRTIQLHNSKGRRHTCMYTYMHTCSEAGFGSQNGDLAEGYTTENSVLLYVLGQKDSMKMFRVYLGKYFSRKVVHSWVTNVSLLTKRLKQRCESG
jgi:hypothetical protein